MKFYKESLYAKSERLRQWHVWFAWHPVRIDEYIVWLEKVKRRKTGMVYEFLEYKLLDDKEKDLT